MAHIVIVYWRDIPAQVIAERGRGRGRQTAKIELPDRFAQAIDAAAMRGAASDADSYLADWRRSDPVECGEDLEAEAVAMADRLNAEYDADRLRALIGTGEIDLDDSG
jgi:hypothetical protein